MSDQDSAFVGRCEDCGKLHAGIILSPRTANEVSSETRAWQRQGMTIEQMTVGEAREQFADDCRRIQEAGVREYRQSDIPEELRKVLERVPVGVVRQDQAVIDALASRFDWPYPDDPFTMALRLCDPDGIVRQGAMHHGTDYPCTGHAHFSGEHIICASPIHWRENLDIQGQGQA